MELPEQIHTPIQSISSNKSLQEIPTIQKSLQEKQPLVELFREESKNINSTDSHSKRKQTYVNELTSTFFMKKYFEK